MLRKYYFYYDSTPVVVWIRDFINVEECIDRNKTIVAFGALGGACLMKTSTLHYVEFTGELKILADLQAESNV